MWMLLALLAACGDDDGADASIDATGVDAADDDADASRRDGDAAADVDGDAPFDPRVLVGGLSSPGDLAISVSGEHLLFTQTSERESSIWRVGTNGEGLVRLADGQPESIEIFLRGDYLYWVGGTYRAMDGVVRRIAVAGGDVEDLATNLQHPTGLVVGNGNVYWTTGPETGAAGIVRTTINAPHMVFAIAVEGTALAIAFDYFYFGTAEGVYRVAPDGGMPERLGDLDGPSPGPWDGTFDMTHLYWATGNDPGVIARVPLTGGESERIVDMEAALFPHALWVAGGYVYFLSEGSLTGTGIERGVSRVPVAGGGAETIDGRMGRGVPLRGGLVLDATHAYWTDTMAGTIRRVEL